MRWIFGLCAVVVLVMVSQVYGEYFRYVDENGVASYTDDLSKVPKKQRVDVKSFISVQQEINKNPDFEKQAPTVEDPHSSLDPSGPDEKKAYEEFKLLKESLDQEFELLNKARDELAMEGKKLKNNTAVRAFNQKASALNDRIKAYELKKQAYLERFTNDVQENTP
ncbi:DUF4124 domain-containing protein [Desulfotignum balticum]|uniref:DUF4124 domain-containing protein n=1 Tax=Desulfotignum balticum TaxID=115781 RepID=UPI000462E44B|nr:DUF4124 domain-containing protein [Desulfotignum balticum]